MSTIQKSTRTRSKKASVVAVESAGSIAPTKNEAVLQALISGLTANTASLPSIAMATGEYTPAELIALLQPGVTAIQTTQAAKASWRDAVTAQAAEMTTILPLVENLKLSLRARFGPKSLVLSQFGIKPTPHTTQSAATKAAAVRKRLATKASKKAAAAAQAPSGNGAAAATTNGTHTVASGTA